MKELRALLDKEFVDSKLYYYLESMDFSAPAFCG